jgi:hypothetical protein
MAGEEKDSSLEAVYQDFSTAMFGSVYDVNLLALSSGKKVTNRMLDRALQITINDPRTNGIGVEPVIKATANPEWAERCLSKQAQLALGRYIRKQEVVKTQKIS